MALQDDLLSQISPCKSCGIGRFFSWGLLCTTHAFGSVSAVEAKAVKGQIVLAAVAAFFTQANTAMDAEVCFRPFLGGNRSVATRAGFGRDLL